jgi:isochorismate synthase
MSNLWSQLWEDAVQSEHAIVVWRLPNQPEKHLMVDATGGVKHASLDLAALPSGFIVAPFEGEPYFLSASHIHSLPVLPFDLPLVKDVPVVVDEVEKAYFKEQVRRSIEKIHLGEFQKVVLSRTAEQIFDPSFDVLEAFDRLCMAYSSAFICAVYLPAFGSTWMCATPEILVSQNKAGVFSTISLAGTHAASQADGTQLSVQEVRWSQKEIEEQAYVSRYIIDCFKRIRLREYVENGPKTVLAGNLMHLKTEYLVDTQKYHYPGLISTMLDLLHPTSAVCGTPKEAAKSWIHSVEKHQRSLYSGYLGPVNVDQETHLFVNLRTVRLEHGTKQMKATYFAGCGITEESVPETEWQETEMKCQTLQRVLSASL